MNHTLYYTDNAKDAMLKPLTEELFDLFTAEDYTRQRILSYRNGVPKEHSKNKLKVFYFQGTLNEPLYNQHLQECAKSGQKPENSRCQSFMLPTTPVMIDLDQPQEAISILWPEIIARLEELDYLDYLLLAHKTPRGEGLRLVLERLPEMMSMDIEEAKTMWLEMIAPGNVSDPSCRDYSRGSFCPMKDEILHINRQRLFAPQLLPMDEVPPLPSTRKSTTAKSSASAEGFAKADTTEHTFPDAYEGTPYSLIIERLIPMLEGSVEEGGRHTLVKGLATHLRYICENNPQWLASVIPTFGLPQDEYNALLSDMCTYSQLAYMPKLLRSAIEGTDKVEEPLWFMPRAPKLLPSSLQLLLGSTPDKMHEAVVMAVFPALGAHLYEVLFHYADNRDYEPAFMHLLVAPQGSGKSAVDTPIDFIMADIDQSDEKNRIREREWREKVGAMGANKEKPRRPKDLCIQKVTPNFTNAALVKLLKDANGHTLYIRINELEQLRGQSNIKGGENEIIKLTYDRSLYGQERVGLDSVNEQAILRLNWNASTTPVMALDFFNQNSIIDGTLSRITCSTILVDEDDWGEEIPIFGTYEADFASKLSAYIQRLNQAQGIYNCPEAIEWAKRTQRLMIQHAKEMNSKTLKEFVFRAVRSGFYRAMLLYIMQGQEWSREIEDFATWSVEYDLWCKWNIFYKRFAKAQEMGQDVMQKSNVSYLDKLPDEFTRDMLLQLRPNATPRTIDDQLRQWKHRKRITHNEAQGIYVKCYRQINNISSRL